MHRDEHRTARGGRSGIEKIADARVIRVEYRLPPCGTLLVRQPEVSWDRRGLAYLGYRARHAGVAIAVDDEAGIGLQHCGGIECRRQAVGDAGDADVPGDMPLQLDV